MTRRARAALFAICAVGIFLRIVATWAWPNLAHPDETIQYLEQAYRLDTGRGLVPWEYAVGARSWLLPLLFAPFLKAGLAVSSLPEVYLWSTTLAMIALAACGIAAAFVLGLRVGGLGSAAFAGGLVAVWPELVELSPHVLADTTAAVPLLGALALVYRVEVPRVRDLVAAGALFGLAFALRIQLAPAIGVAMVGLCVPMPRARQLLIGLGFAAPVLIMGLVDWVALGLPFRSVFTYLRVNGGGVADAFGTAPSWAYLAEEVVCWGAATTLIVPTAYFGARRMPLPALVVATILLTFSLVGHKEPRFIYPAVPLLFMLCGVGTGDVVARTRAGHDDARRRPIWAGCAVLWVVLSIVTAARDPMQVRWHGASGWLRAFARINADRSACGVGLIPARLWFLTGDVRLRADISLYDGDTAVRQGADAAAYNYLLDARPSASTTFAHYKFVGCDGWVQKICTYRRDGPCDPAAAHRLAAVPEPGVVSVLGRIGLRPR